MQRVGREFENEIKRYISRYQAASKAYLSTNLETLIAHLLEKKKPVQLAEWFDQESETEQSAVMMDEIHSWFPQSQSYLLWTARERFHEVLRKGCWPLAPMSTWTLFSLTAAGKHLQERSALTLLAEIFQRFAQDEVPKDGSLVIHPVDLWSSALQEELLASEEAGSQGSIANAYASVVSRYESQLTENLVRMLRGIVLCSKLNLRAESKEDAFGAIGSLVGASRGQVEEGIARLEDEYNIIQWDQGFKQWDVLGDGVPRNQFLAFVRQRVAGAFDGKAKADLFSRKITEWSGAFEDVVPDFAEDSAISTREWAFRASTTTLEFVEATIRLEIARWKEAFAVHAPRGSVIYCYVEAGCQPEVVEAQVKKLLRSAERDAAVSSAPVFVVLLWDVDGVLGQTMAELAVLEEDLSEEEKGRFGNLVASHVEKARQKIEAEVEGMLKCRRYVTALKDPIEPGRLKTFGRELFSRIYTRPLPFPFDGFTVTGGNAADSCQEFTRELLTGRMDFDTVIAKQPKDKNRGTTVLNDSWRIFGNTGKVLRRPNNPILARIIDTWDSTLKSGSNICIGAALAELCRPPHGANIASAGLALGVFVAPRATELVVVEKGEQLALSQWVQDGAFKGKYIDIEGARSVELALIGEASSEWESLLEEWDQEETHSGRTMYLERAEDLKERIPVPPDLRYRYSHLVSQAEASLKALIDLNDQESVAHKRIAHGESCGDVSFISRGAAELVKLQSRLQGEGNVWTEDEVNSLAPAVDRSRQLIIQAFPSWLERQIPSGNSPDAIGEFKRRMTHLIGGNLQELGLEAERAALIGRANELAKKSEDAADASQLVRNVDSWLQQHTEVFRIIRVAELRGLVALAKDYTQKLQGMSRRVDIPQLAEARQRISEFLAKVKAVQKEVDARAEKLLKTKLQPGVNIEELREEVDDLIGCYEGCEADLEDFRLMRRALRRYQEIYERLANEKLSWAEFECLAEELGKEAKASLSDEGVPWDVNETMTTIVEGIRKSRQAASLSWIKSLESEAEAISVMAVPEADALYRKAAEVPPQVTEPHGIRAETIQKKLQKHLESLHIEWLYEKFKQLPEKSRLEFLRRVSSAIDGA